MALRPLLILAVAGAIMGSGCAGEERRARAQVATFLAAMEAGDDARACATMTPRLQKAISTELRVESEPGTCWTRAADVYSPAKAPGNDGATVKAITVAGDRSQAIVTAHASGPLATGPVESVVVLERQQEQWLIADF